MIITQVIGSKATEALDGLRLDWLELEWFETSKRILRKRTTDGMEIAIRFLNEGQRLRHDDVLFMDEQKAVLIHVKPCNTIVVRPGSLLEMGTVCYEIGNKHLPVFIQDDEVLIPYEEPLFRWLLTSGYKPTRETRRLLNMLRSNVKPHDHGDGTLFSRIMKLATQS